MKAHFHKVPTPLRSSFGVRHDTAPNFGTIWHYHPELELHLTVKGEGVRFIGDNISNFSAGQLILLGENLPHTWRCREEYYQPGSGLEVEAIVIHFRPDCLGRDLLDLPEAFQLPKLFEKAKKGLEFHGKAREKIAKLMIAITKAEDLDRLILMLSLLREMSLTGKYTTIASAHGFYKSNEIETIRINKVCAYTLSNYKKDITLEQIAAISNLSVTSFCRYFKTMTKKTYYDFLTEIRVSHACRHLIDGSMTISMICFESGFNNISNFYRHFKKVTGITPSEYRKNYENGWT